MENKYLEKIAGAGLDIAFKGTNYAKNKVANIYGKKGPDKDFANDYSNDSKAGLRAAGRGILTAAAGGFLSAHGATGLANRAIKRGATTTQRGRTFVNGMSAIGAGAGYIGGIAKSFNNQGKELHKKYQEKSAALNMLIDEGVDFETAADLVMEKAAFLDMAAGALASTEGHRWGGAGVGLLGGLAGGYAGHALGGTKGALIGNIAGGALAGHLYGKKSERSDVLKKIVSDSKNNSKD